MKRFLLILTLVLSFSMTSCGADTMRKEQSNEVAKAQDSMVKIDRHPEVADFGRGILNSLPKYDPNSTEGWQVDLRGYDLSSLDISSRLDDLIYASFDSRTKWPKKLPMKFNPEDIMKLGKNPGLSLNKLHGKGITGKGIGIAIIDQALLVDHEEYKDSLKLYQEIHWPIDKNKSAQMHGPAVASIAVGKNIGVAPDADLYYIAEEHGEFKNNSFEWDFTPLAQSIDKILEINKTLPKDRKIRVISISVGWDKSQKGYDEVTAAVNRAKEEGIFVVSSSLRETYGYFFNGLGRDPLSNPDKTTSYKTGSWWSSGEYWTQIEEMQKQFNIKDSLLVPMDSRTTASPTGNSDYVFYREGGWSWSIPYIAGLYVLACQADPEITPDKFWQTALSTGDPLNIDKDGKEYYVGKIANPIKLIEELKK